MYADRTPPPVPPKDQLAGNDVDRPPTSGSKRKRSIDDSAAFQVYNGSPSSEDEGHTPKRYRSAVPSSGGGETSDENITRSVRRKKGSRNLSNLNLRHAAQKQSKQAIARGSRFFEGSLTDKPSGTPPSMFTRFPRRDGDDLGRMDNLMAAYHDPEGGGEQEQAYETDEDMSGAGSAMSEQEPKSFFRFGKSLSKFYPFGLWNRVYDETHNKLLEQNRLEAERKARLKAEAEAKYAEMKSAGQLDPVVLSTLRASLSTPTPRDSFLAPDSNRSSFNHKRTVSVGSELATSQDYAADQEMLGVPVTEPKTLRTSNSRFNLKRPSFSNLKNGLKRVASDLNLAAFGARDREISAPISPEKVDDQPQAPESVDSRFGGKSKDTLRLHQRVSDLERELFAARTKLNNALQEASPAPGSGGKFQRFTPSTIRKSRFVPGNLPSLPSERLLFPQESQSVTNQSNQSGVEEDDYVYDEDEDNQETIRASRAQVLRPRVSSLFKPWASQSNSLQQDHTVSATVASSYDLAHSSKQVTMDPNSITDSLRIDPTVRPADGASLTDRLKAIDNAAKLAKKDKRSKKRKSSLEMADLTYKPSAEEDDDDAHWAAAAHTPKKKLKASKKSETNLAGKASTNTKKRSSTSSTVHADRSSIALESEAQEQPSLSINTSSEAAEEDYVAVTAATQPASFNVTENEPVSPLSVAHSFEPASPVSITHSLEPVSPVSVAHSLEPVYEEEEETTTVPLKDEPSKPTAKATPARYNVNALRVRSTSPEPRADGAKSGIKSVLQAGSIAKHRRGTRTVSPLPIGVSTIDEILEETYTAVPGRNGVPDMPKVMVDSVRGSVINAQHDAREGSIDSAKAGRRSGGPEEGFEWPEDVF